MGKVPGWDTHRKVNILIIPWGKSKRAQRQSRERTFSVKGVWVQLLLLGDKPSQTFGHRTATVLFFCMASVGSGIQKRHSGDGLFLLHDVWTSSEKAPRPGRDDVKWRVKSSEGSFTPCLVVDAAYHPGPQKGPLLEYLYVASPCGCFGFLTTWWLHSMCKLPKKTRHKLPFMTSPQKSHGITSLQTQTNPDSRGRNRNPPSNMNMAKSHWKRST